MRMTSLLNQITRKLGEEHIQRSNAYEIVFYIRGRYYVIRNMKLDYYNYEWNVSLMEVGSEEYNNRYVGDTLRLNELLSLKKSYENRFQNLLHKKVNFVYKNYGYTYILLAVGLMIKEMRVDESESQIVFYFE